jgi:DNA uptake protein ComE-like DNA-binding protein
VTGESRAGNSGSRWDPDDSEIRKWRTGEHVSRSPRKTALEDRGKEVENLRSELERRENELDQTLEKREAEFVQGLREIEEAFNERRSKLGERAAALEKRLEAREAELREQAAQREELEGRIDELEAALADAKRKPPAKPMATESETRQTTAERSPLSTGTTEGVGLDVNSATFEQLRDLGLSVTLSARIIAHRDTRRGFESLDDLDWIPGIPSETRAALRSQLRV